MDNEDPASCENQESVENIPSKSYGWSMEFADFLLEE